MAATFLQALVERYDAVSGLPAMYSALIPEGETRTYPCALIEHQGEVPHYESSISEGARVVKTLAKATILIWAVGLAATEALASALMQALTPKSLNIDGQACDLFRKDYRVNAAAERSRQNEIVFVATISYMAEID